MKSPTMYTKSQLSCNGFTVPRSRIFKGDKSGVYYAYTLWLFTFSDLKTTVLPVTIFGIASALSGPLMTNVSQSPSAYELFSRLPLVIFATWLKVLVGTIANQRLPSSIVEDSINKKWRPIPAGLLSEEGAMQWLLISIPITVFTSIFFGGTLETLVLLILMWMYDDLGGSDSNMHIRHLINGVAYICLNASAAIIASPATTPNTFTLGTLTFTTPLTLRAYIWLLLMGITIATTIALGDLEDMPGDAAKGRRTLPLVYGERVARLALGLVIFVESVSLPAFWQVNWIVYGFAVGFGGMLAGMTAFGSGVKEAKVTWRMWSVWLIILYFLPVWKAWEMGQFALA